MKLIVCGDSFMSADVNRPNTHFSELLNEHGFTVINLARGGISNTGIAFQLETASRLKPNAIVFSSTSNDRIDLVMKDKKFNPLKGLKNFIYPYKSDSSTGSEYVGGLDSSVLSDVIPAFLFPRPDLPVELHDPKRSEIVKQYLSLFHDVDFKKILDTWIIDYWKYRLTEIQIPFIHLYKGAKLGQSMYAYVDKNPDKVTQCVYHTDELTQILMANELNIELKRLIT
jgi:hypothetical protein